MALCCRPGSAPAAAGEGTAAFPETVFPSVSPPDAFPDEEGEVSPVPAAPSAELSRNGKSRARVNRQNTGQKQRLLHKSPIKCNAFFLIAFFLRNGQSILLFSFITTFPVIGSLTCHGPEGEGRSASNHASQPAYSVQSAPPDRCDLFYFLIPPSDNEGGSAGQNRRP